MRPASSFGSDSAEKVSALVHEVKQLLDGGERSRLLEHGRLPTVTLLPVLQQQLHEFEQFLQVQGVQPGRRGSAKVGKSLDAIITGLKRFCTLVPVACLDDLWFYVRTGRGVNLNPVAEALRQGNYAEATIRNTFYAVLQVLPFAQLLVCGKEPTSEMAVELADLTSSVNQLISQSHVRSVLQGDQGRKLRELQDKGHLQDAQFPVQMIRYAQASYNQWKAIVESSRRQFYVR